MKKGILLLSAVLLIITAVPVFSQAQTGKTVVRGEYHQTQLELLREYHLRKALAYGMQTQRPETEYVNSTSPGMYVSKGFANTFFLRNRFGVSTLYMHRIKQDLYYVGEFAYYLASENDQYPTMFNRFSGGQRNVPNAMIFPLYFGIRKGISLKKYSRFYPYVGAGAGPAFAVGSIPNQFNNGSNYNFEITPTLYAITGIELYTFKRMFVDLNVRYRYLKFNDPIAMWRDFSGASIGIGFGYGARGMQLLR